MQLKHGHNKKEDIRRLEANEEVLQMVQEERSLMNNNNNNNDNL